MTSLRGHLVNGHVLVPAGRLFFNFFFFAMLAAVCVLTQFMVNRPQGKQAGEFINPQHAILNFPKADPDRVIIKRCSDWKYFSPQ